jgi:hypothetical protein
MSEDNFTRTTSTSWLQRLGSAFGGILVGLILLIGGVVLLAGNEQRTVKASRAADEAGRTAVGAPADRIDPALDGQLVHVVGEVAAPGLLVDEATGKSVAGLRLVREVEFYQWRETASSETRTKLGGGQETVTTYSYAQGWSPDPVDSAGFARPEGHANPAPWTGDADLTPVEAQMGPYRLTQDALERLPAREVLRPTAAEAEAAAQRLGRPVTVVDDALFVGASAAQPQVGDVRIRYAMAPAGQVTVVGRQAGADLVPHATRTGGAIFELRAGTVPAAEVLRQVEAANQTLSWVLRGVGMVVLAIGFGLILNPLKVLADVLPPLGALVGAGTGLVSVLLALVAGGVTIALAWVAVRPLVGLAALAVSGLAVAGLIMSRRRGAKG